MLSINRETVELAEEEVYGEKITSETYGKYFKKTKNTIAVYIPARNEADASIKDWLGNPSNDDGIWTNYERYNISKTIKSLKDAADFVGATIDIVVINDGSRDNTSQVAKDLGAMVIDLPDRGFSALGRPELSETHNAGLSYIRKHFASADYIMVSGADTVYEMDYFLHILKEFKKNPKLMICGGRWIEGVKSSPRAVRGSGRIYKWDLMAHLDFKLPFLYSWESYPLYWAQASGFETYSLEESRFSSLRTPYGIVNWKYYGYGMYEIGFTFPYVFGRALKTFLAGKPTYAIKLVWGWIIAHFMKSINRYPKHVRKYIRGYQWARILKVLTLGKINRL